MSFGGWLLEARTLLVWSSLAVAAMGALAILFELDSPLRAQVVRDCAIRDEPGGFVLGIRDLGSLGAHAGANRR